MDSERDIPGFRGLATTRGVIGLVLTLGFGAVFLRAMAVVLGGGDLSAAGAVTRPWRGVQAAVIFVIAGVVLIREAWTGESDKQTPPPEYPERLKRSWARKRKRRNRRRDRG